MLKQIIFGQMTVNSFGTQMLTKVGEYFLSLIAFLTITFHMLFEDIDGLLGVLIMMMVIDYITGLTNGFMHKSLNSKIGWIGLSRKITIFLVILMAVVIDHHLNLSSLLSITTIVFYMVNECLSIIENASKIGIPIPKKLQDTLEQLRKDNDKYEG